MEIENRTKEIQEDINCFFERLESLGCFGRFDDVQKEIIRMDLKNLVLQTANEFQGIMNDLYYNLKNN